MTQPLVDAISETGERRPVALVTGASDGFGRELARVLADEGYDLIVVARTEHKLAYLQMELESSCGVQVEVWPADLSREQDRRFLADRISRQPDLKVVVNNAARGHLGSFHRTSPAILEEMVHLNLSAPLALSWAALNNPDFASGGTLINVSSVAADVPTPLDGLYGATKSAVDGLSRAIAHELERNPELDVHVQIAKLGGLRTGFMERAAGEISPERQGSNLNDRLSQDPSKAARAIWRQAKRRSKAIAFNSPAARVEGLIFRLFPRLGARVIRDGFSREIERRRGGPVVFAGACQRAVQT